MTAPLDPVGVSAAAKALAIHQTGTAGHGFEKAATLTIEAYLAVAGSPADERASTDEEFTEAAWGLIANAYGGNWSDAPDEWHGAACRWRDEYTAGATARIPAASPADERLREALERANDDLILIADESPEGVGESIDSVRAAIKDALAAADREKPEE